MAMKGPLVPWSPRGLWLVQGTRHQLFARAGFAGDEHRHIALAQAADGAKHILHRRRLAEDFGHLRGVPALVIDLFAQAFIHCARRISSTALRQIEGLGQVLERAALEGGDGAVQIRVSRHDDDGQVPAGFSLTLASKSRPGAAGHADVADTSTLRLVIDSSAVKHVTRVGEAAHRQLPSRAKRLFEHKADGLVVVNDPDGFHGLGFQASLLSCRQPGSQGKGILIRPCGPGPVRSRIQSCPDVVARIVCARVSPRPEPPSRPDTSGIEDALLQALGRHARSVVLNMQFQCQVCQRCLPIVTWRATRVLQDVMTAGALRRCAAHAKPAPRFARC